MTRFTTTALLGVLLLSCEARECPGPCGRDGGLAADGGVTQQDAGAEPVDAGVPDAGVADAGSPDAGSAAPGQRLFIPSYFYPGPLWTQATAAAPGVGVLVINPASGPGAQVDPAYVQVTQAAEAAGIAVLGYVSTSWGARDAADVRADIHRCFDGYAVSGIFLDEAPGTADCAALQAHYASLAATVRGRDARALVVLNPGTDTCESYLSFADVLCTFEGEVPAYDAYVLPAWTQAWPAERFLHLVHGVPASDAQRIVGLSRERRAGFVYVTDDVLPNPWDTLPSYFADEVTWVSAPWVRARSSASASSSHPSAEWPTAHAGSDASAAAWDATSAVPTGRPKRPGTQKPASLGASPTVATSPGATPPPASSRSSPSPLSGTCSERWTCTEDHESCTPASRARVRSADSCSSVRPARSKATSARRKAAQGAGSSGLPGSAMSRATASSRGRSAWPSSSRCGASGTTATAPFSARARCTVGR
ncbi:MAG: hypothetical protein RL653_2672 [Pseudomonadota bacterium]